MSGPVQQAVAEALRPFWSLARTDVYAIRTPDGPRWVKGAAAGPGVTLERVAAHLNGGPQIGVAFVRAGEDVCWQAALDFDSHKGEVPWPAMVEQAQRVAQTMRAAGLTAIPFRSNGGNGIHLRVLFERQQSARAVRRVLGLLLEMEGLRSGTRGVAHGEVEVFPKQDRVAADGFGNQMFLPCGGKGAPLEVMLGWEPMPVEYVIGADWPLSGDVPEVVDDGAGPAAGAGGAGGAGREGGVSLADLRSALAAIPNEGAGLGYDDWRDILFGVWDATGGSAEGLELAQEFSARSDKHDPAFLEHRVWAYIKPGAMTWRTVLAKARDHGWQPDVSADFEVVGTGVAVLRAQAQARAAAPPTALTVGTGPGAAAAWAALIGPAGMPPGMQMGGPRNRPVPLNNLHNAVLALQAPGYCGWLFAWDEFKDEIVMAPSASPGVGGRPAWRRWTDERLTELRVSFARMDGLDFTREVMRDAVQFVARQRKMDSAKEWLTGLPPWDGVPRVANFMTTHYGAEAGAYSQAVSRYWWTAHAGRVLEPGAQADIMVVMVGLKQGEGKTSGLRAMVPDPSLCGDVNLELSDADIGRSMRGKLVFELAELRGFSGRKAEASKAWLSRRFDEWVPKYMETAIRYPRRGPITGTTNEDAFLTDATGNRRFAPLRTPRVDVDAIARDYPQLWAEARAMFLAGGIAWQDVHALAAEQHADFAVEDPWHEALVSYLETPTTDIDGVVRPSPRERGTVTTAEILSGALNIPTGRLSRADQMRVAALLRKIGATRERAWARDGMRGRAVYRLPQP